MTSFEGKFNHRSIFAIVVFEVNESIENRIYHLMQSLYSNYKVISSSFQFSLEEFNPNLQVFRGDLPNTRNGWIDTPAFLESLNFCLSYMPFMFDFLLDRHDSHDLHYSF